MRRFFVVHPTVVGLVLGLLPTILVPIAHSAVIPGLYNTGTGDNGQLLANGVVDPHYRLIQSPDASSPGPNAFVVTDTLFPIVTGPWLASGPTSKWIGPMANQSAGSQFGNYTYRTTFDLTGLDPTSAVITGRWTSDNGAMDILVNGQSTGLNYGGDFTVFSPYWSISTGFIDGTNTLDFVINNGGTTINPTAVRIELSGTASLPPPPGTPPTITRQPVGVSVALQEPASFSVSATGSRPLIYQWRRAGQAIANGTNPTYSIASASGASAGSYDVVVSNASGSVTSSPVALTVLFQRPGVPAYEPPGPASRRTGLVISEIMYHPADRADGRNGEFIELYNSNPYFEDISGWRLSGQLDFTFPPDTRIPGNSYLLIAPSPSDVQAIYGVTGVLGGGTNKLSNSSGTVRLTKRSGGVVLEVTYSDEAPWPVAADGTGHSLVLVRPSFGQGNPVAWAASARIGGSPGAADPASTDPIDNVVINEVLAHTPLPLLDYLELYNYSPFTVDLSGCWLSDDPATNKFRIPNGTILNPRGFISFNETQMGFSLGASGEKLFLVNAGQTRVIDAIRFGGQATGVASGRFPDGAPTWSPLSAQTPGTTNAPEASATIVINELLYDPLSGDSDDEFVEIYNRTGQAVALDGWKLSDGVSFTFPPGSSIGPGGYLVVAANAQRLASNYPGLSGALIAGSFSGNLANGGERAALTRPESIVSTNLTNGIVTTNIVQIVVDEVSYQVGGKWGRWSAGGGSSFELIDAHATRRQAGNWADSDETTKASWTVVEATGPLDLGFPALAAADQLQVMLQGPGEALVDLVEVLVAGANRIPNPSFESGINGWFFQGTHSRSFLETTEGFDGARSLHVVASERGDHVANRIRAPLSTPIPSGTVVTIRARVRWLKGHPEILFRLRGGWLEAIGRLTVPKAVGTPGAPNSRALANVGPTVSDVTHRPLLPAAGQPIRVTARVQDPDGIQAVTLRYRLDPSTTVNSVAMVDDGTGDDLIAGDGIFTGTIPGQVDGTFVAFQVQSVDQATPLAGTSLFPNAGHECLVRVGDPASPGQFGTYRLWLTASSVSTWANREKMSNEDIDSTFIYGTSRAIYNAGAHYSGSSYTAPGYNSPVGNLCGYDINLPEDDSVLGETHLTLDWPIRDTTDQREQLMFWLLEQYGLPNNYRRYVQMFVNGTKRGAIYDDVQQPSGDLISEFFPNDSDGSLWKTDCWNEFDDAGNRVDPCVLNSLEIFSSSGVKKIARYRWNWRPRAVNGTVNDFSDLFALVDVMNASSAGYQSSVNGLVDVEHWMRTFAMNDLASFWDAFGNPNAKNTFLYKPAKDGWKLFSWDFDVGLGVFNDPVNADLFPALNDPTMTRLYNTPVFVRGYWRALEEGVNSFFQASAVTPLLTDKFNAFVSNNVALTSPFVPSGAYGLSITDWITQRRSFLQTQLAKVAAPFSITGTTNIVTGNNLLRISGTAPVAARDITINGILYPVTWTSISNWTVTVPIAANTTSLTLDARGTSGQVLGGTTRTFQVDYTGTDEDAATNVVINEIMYHPMVSEATYVELFNRSANYSFDLSGWRLNGADYTFPPGTIITNGGFLVLAKNREAFAAAYGAGVPVIGLFEGQLDNGGETLTLLRPAGSGGPEVIVDQVRYDDQPPWPAAADGQGAALQLIDPSQDHTRVSNWSDGSGWRFFSYTGPVGSASLTRLSMYFEPQGGDVYLDDLSLVLGSVPESGPNALANGGFESGFNQWTRGPLATNSEVVNTVAHSGGASLHLTIAAGAQSLTTFYQDFASLTPSTNYTISFWYLAGTKGTNLNMRLNTQFRLALNPVSVRATPGANNTGTALLPPFPPLWLSEVQPSNLSTLADNFGEFEPWIELFNAGLQPLDLSGVYLANSLDQLLTWPFPPGTTINPGQYLLVWADGEPGESAPGNLHTSFRLNPTNGTVVLSRQLSGGPQILDYLNYTGLGPNQSIGSFPAGGVGGRDVFFTPTPRAANDAPPPAVPIWINEWMASNTGFIVDPADGHFDDWFELYNPGATEVNLTGYQLSDESNNPSKFVVPAGVRIPAHGFLLVWADEEVGQNRTNGDLHVNFKLSQAGESIFLHDPVGQLVDSITFGSQTANISGGRYPDGAPAPFVAMSSPTPRSANVSGAGGPVLGTIEPLGNGLIRLTWTAQAGRSYRIQFKTALDEPQWTDLAGDVLATGGSASRTDAGNSVRRFYRVMQLP